MARFSASYHDNGEDIRDWELGDGWVASAGELDEDHERVGNILDLMQQGSGAITRMMTTWEGSEVVRTGWWIILITVLARASSCMAWLDMSCVPSTCRSTPVSVAIAANLHSAFA